MTRKRSLSLAIALCGLCLALAAPAEAGSNLQSWNLKPHVAEPQAENELYLTHGRKYRRHGHYKRRHYHRKRHWRGHRYHGHKWRRHYNHHYDYQYRGRRHQYHYPFPSIFLRFNINGTWWDRHYDPYNAGNSGNALEYARSGTEVRWHNADQGHDYALTPVRTYQRYSGEYCREFTLNGWIGNKQKTLYGTACRTPDGDWQVSQDRAGSRRQR